MVGVTIERSIVHHNCEDHTVRGTVLKHLGYNYNPKGGRVCNWWGKVRTNAQILLGAAAHNIPSLPTVVWGMMTVTAGEFIVPQNNKTLATSPRGQPNRLFL